MRTYIIAVAALIVLCGSNQRVSSLALQERQSVRVLVEQFRASAVFWRQFDIGKKIVGLQSSEAFSGLEPWLTHEDRHIRGNVAFVFAALGDQRGLEVIAAILNDQSDRPEGQGVPAGRWSLNGQIRADRYYAVHLLGEIRHARGVDWLVPLLTDEQVNYKAAWALGEIGDSRAIGPLIDGLRDMKALMRISAIHGLEKLRAKEALPYLRGLQNDRELPSAGDQVSVADTARAATLKLESEP
jgi:HEAT repeat protein